MAAIAEYAAWVVMKSSNLLPSDSTQYWNVIV